MPTSRRAEVVIGLIAILMPVVGVAQTYVDFSIPAGSTVDALDRFGEQSGLQVIYDYSQIGRRESSLVHGFMPPGEALDRIVADTGLAWRRVNEETIVVHTAELPPRRTRRRTFEAPPQTDGVLTDLTVIASAHRGLPRGPSAAAFGFDKSLVETPRAVSVVSAATIDTLGLSAVEDLARVVPGVYTTTRWGIQGSIDVRNVPADTYFRGMKRLNLQGHGRSVLAAMETIEVVKGPPSPIYGMGKIGGYTNMVPRSVRAANGSYVSATEGFVQGVSGSFDKSEMSFGVGGPLPFETKPAGYYVYGLFEDSGSFIEKVPIDQGVLQAAISVDDFAGSLRLETGVNVQRSRTAGALIGRFTQELADTGRYIRGSPLVDLDANGNGRIGYLEMYAGSPILGNVSNGNQALRQVWDWPTNADGSYVPLDELASVPGIPQAMYDYLVAHPEADPSGLLRAAGPGGPQPRSGYVPAGFALDPRTVGYDELDLRRAGAFERELEADFVTAYFDVIDDANPERTFKNQLFFDSMDQYKVSDQPFSQLQDVLVIEDKATLTRRLKRGPGVDVNALFSANVRHVSSSGATASGDYATHRGDAMAPPSALPVFATALTNPELQDDGWPWTARYATDSTELGVGAAFDIDVDERNNFIVGARLDRSYVENVDFAGTLNLSAGTAADPAVFRAAEDRASAHETGASWSVSWSHRLPRNARPYVTLADVSVALDENNNKYDNDVIVDGHIGRARLAEVGFKGSLLEDRLFFSTAVYEQRRVDADLEDDGSVLDAHATATLTRGWEGEVRWGLSPELFVALYALHQETFFRPNAQANIMVDARTLGFRDIVDGAGNVIYPAEAFLYGGRAFLALPPNMAAYDEKQGNPATQLGVLAEYEFGEGRGVTLSGNYFSSAYSGRLRLAELPSAYVVNVGVFWRFDKWQLKYDVLNVFDERYFRARTGDTLGDSLVSAMPGRRWQLTLRASF